MLAHELDFESLWDLGIIHVEFSPVCSVFKESDGMPPFATRMKKMMNFDDHRILRFGKGADNLNDSEKEKFVPMTPEMKKAFGEFHLQTTNAVFCVQRGSIKVDIQLSDGFSYAIPEYETFRRPDEEVWFFNSKRKPFGCFANFFESPITFPARTIQVAQKSVELPETTFPSVEHFFQAHKFVLSPKDFADAAAAKTGKDAATIGRDHSRPLREDWEKIKSELMEEGVLAKFTQHKDLLEILLATGNRPIFESSPKDNFWGTGSDGHGKNMLGRILERVREKLAKEFPEIAAAATEKFAQIKALTATQKTTKSGDEGHARIVVPAGVLFIVPPGCVHRMLPHDDDADIEIVQFLRKDDKTANEKMHTLKPDQHEVFTEEVPDVVKLARNDYLERFLWPYHWGFPRYETVLGPLSGDNLYVAKSKEIDKVLAKVTKELRNASQVQDLAVVYLTGAHNQISKKSWCPHCWDADAKCVEAMSAARVAFPGRRFIFIQIAIQRSMYLNKDNNPFTAHPFLQLKSVPSLIAFSRTGTGKFSEHSDFMKDVKVIHREEGASLRWLGKLDGGVAAINECLGPDAPDIPTSPPVSPPTSPSPPLVEEVESPGSAYLRKHGLHQFLQKALAIIVQEEPENPLEALHVALGKELEVRKKKEGS